MYAVTIKSCCNIRALTSERTKYNVELTVLKGGSVGCVCYRPRYPPKSQVVQGAHGSHMSYSSVISHLRWFYAQLAALLCFSDHKQCVLQLPHQLCPCFGMNSNLVLCIKGIRPVAVFRCLQSNLTKHKLYASTYSRVWLRVGAVILYTIILPARVQLLITTRTLSCSLSPSDRFSQHPDCKQYLARVFDFVKDFMFIPRECTK